MTNPKTFPVAESVDWDEVRAAVAKAAWPKAGLVDEAMARIRAAMPRPIEDDTPTDAWEGQDAMFWPTETFVGQLRMQSRDSLDPEYSQFMAATATHLGILSGQCDAQREIAERAKEDAARLRAHCEAMSRALETAERQITAAFGIIHPGDNDLLEGSLESIRQPIAAYRGENAS